MLKRIKNFLGRFLPLPANSAHRMNNALLQNFELIQRNVNLLRNEIIETNTRIGDIEICVGKNTFTEEVDVITLDEYVSQNCIEVGLIKVDIEGAEQMFLQGAKETLCSQKPILIISIYHSPEDFFFIKPEIESWNLGYTFKIYKCMSEGFITETILIAEP